MIEAMFQGVKPLSPNTQVISPDTPFLSCTGVIKAFLNNLFGNDSCIKEPVASIHFPGRASWWTLPLESLNE